MVASKGGVLRPPSSGLRNVTHAVTISPRVALADLAGGETALLQILLMVVLGDVEGFGGDDLRHDGTAILLLGLQALLGCLRGGLLLRRVVEDDRAILVAHVWPLPVELGRVVVLPEN